MTMVCNKCGRQSSNEDWEYNQFDDIECPNCKSDDVWGLCD